MTEATLYFRVLIHGAGAGGWMLLALVGTALVATGVAMVGGPRATTVRGRIVAVLPAVLAIVCSCVALGIAISEQRSQVVRAALEGGTPHELWPPIYAEHVTLWLLAPVLALGVPGTSYALARIAPARLRTLIVNCVSIAALTGAVTTWLIARIESSTLKIVPTCMGGVLGWAPDARGLAGLASELDLFEVAIAFVAVFALGVVLLQRLRDREPITRTRMGPLTAISIFGVGALAFAATRGHAIDRHRSVSLLADQFTAPEAPTWLDADACKLPTLAPIVDLTQLPVVRVDGRYTRIEAVQEELEIRRRMYLVMHPRGPLPAAVLVRARADTPMTSVRPVLESIIAAGYGSPSFVFTLHRPARAATLGTRTLERACAVGVRLDLVPREPIDRMPPRDIPPDPETLEQLLLELCEHRRAMVSVLADGVVE